MIKMIVRLCHIEHIPVEDSSFHNALKQMGMQDASDRLSYEIEFPRDEECATSIQPLTLLSEP